ncbi:MAG: hypothetical protein KDH92_05400 [Chloroflexi bacterium]|nr:hypothetical protein [Chloroflexota bacterium]
MIVTRTHKFQSKGEWEITKVDTAFIADYDTYVVHQERVKDIPGLHPYSDFHRLEDEWLWIDRGADGRIVGQRGRKSEVTVPDLVTSMMDVGIAPPDFDSPSWNIRHDEVVAVSGTDLNAAIAAGDVRLIARGDTELAVRATIVEFQEVYDGGPVTQRIWIDELHGVKLRVESEPADSSYHALIELVGYDLDVDLSGFEFRPAVDSATASAIEVNYFEIEAATDDSTRFLNALGVSGLLVPPLRSLNTLVHLDASALIRGTAWDDWGWFLAQELSEGSGRGAVVIQGDDRSSLPLPNQPYWPPDWGEIDPVTWEIGTLRDHSRESFADSTPVDVYQCTPNEDLPPGVFALSCDFLITWVDGVNVRVVVLPRGYSRAASLQLADLYRDAARSE